MRRSPRRGREIVEFVQRGAKRAEYGEQVLEVLSARLGERVGRGYSVTNLKYFRLFYQAFADREPKIRQTVSGESVRPPARQIRQTVSDELTTRRLDGFSPHLGWSHYQALSKVESAGERSFYEIEAEAERWSVRDLERQIQTQLFVRLLKSRDKAGVMDLARRGQVVERPIDLMKSPVVLDFLDLPESEVLRESDLESAILSNLSHFLLELGKGFAFVARQKRLTFDDVSYSAIAASPRRPPRRRSRRSGRRGRRRTRRGDRDEAYDQEDSDTGCVWTVERNQIGRWLTQEPRKTRLGPRPANRPCESGCRHGNGRHDFGSSSQQHKDSSIAAVDRDERSGV